MRKKLRVSIAAMSIGLFAGHEGRMSRVFEAAQEALVPIELPELPYPEYARTYKCLNLVTRFVKDMYPNWQITRENFYV